MRQWWRWLLTVRHPDRRVRRRGTVLIAIAATTAAGLLPLVALFPFIVPAGGLASGLVAALCLTFAGVVALARRGRTTWGGAVLLLTCAAAILAGALIAGNASTHPVFVIALVLLGGLVLPPRALPLLLGAAVGVDLALPLVVGGRTTGLDYQQIAVFCGIVTAFAALVATVNTRVVDRAFVSADRQRERAEHLAAELQEANADLERRVAERTGALTEALARQAELTAQLAELSTRDPLTGLGNRRRLDAELDLLAGRAPAPLSLAVADLDDFKRVNDTFGHHVGDVVLRRAAAAIADACRSGDVVTRTGGEEFVLLLPGAAAEDARARCERVRAAVAAVDLDDVVPGLRTTISLGVATAPAGTDREVLLRRADDLLYAAKRAGKDRVACAPATVP
ncbi:diguanylate cyclase [Kineococcus glutinatus]|uniref:GGDEF domain-containing protein n=1 Tax=Kineococcus glutinatus TaxID=1070872 RepID=A0ABP9HKG8_9ACTN